MDRRIIQLYVMNVRYSKRAMSDIIAALLLIAITAAAAVLLYGSFTSTNVMLIFSVGFQKLYANRNSLPNV